MMKFSVPVGILLLLVLFSNSAWCHNSDSTTSGEFKVHLALGTQANVHGLCGSLAAQYHKDKLIYVIQYNAFVAQRISNGVYRGYLERVHSGTFFVGGNWNVRRFDFNVSGGVTAGYGQFERKTSGYNFNVAWNQKYYIQTGFFGPTINSSVLFAIRQNLSLGISFTSQFNFHYVHDYYGAYGNGKEYYLEFIGNQNWLQIKVLYVINSVKN